MHIRFVALQIDHYFIRCPGILFYHLGYPISATAMTGIGETDLTPKPLHASGDSLVVRSMII